MTSSFLLSPFRHVTGDQLLIGCSYRWLGYRRVSGDQLNTRPEALGFVGFTHIVAPLNAVSYVFSSSHFSFALITNFSERGSKCVCIIVTYAVVVEQA